MKWKKEIIGNMTIKEIAQLAQVSSAAVSRYLNGNDSIILRLAILSGEHVIINCLNPFSFALSNNNKQASLL